MTLAADLRRFADEFARRCPPEWGPTLGQVMDTLGASPWAAKIPKVGEPAPDFRLPDVDGAEVSLAEVRVAGPTIVSFYRGGWCPYCSLELRAYQALWPRLRAAGVNLLAVSAESPERQRQVRATHGFEFPMLVDTDFSAAEAYGLTFEVPEDLLPIMRELGHDPERVNADGARRLVVPGTFVLSPQAQVLEAFADMNYQRRLEPEAALAAARP